MKKLILGLCLFSSLSTFAVDIDTCSQSTQDKQLEALERGSRMLDREVSEVTMKYLIYTGYSKVDCAQYEKQIDAILVNMTINGYS